MPLASAPPFWALFIWMDPQLICFPAAKVPSVGGEGWWLQEISQDGKFLLQHRSQAAVIQSRIFLCFSSFFFFFFAAQGPVVLGQGDGSHPGALPGSEDGADSAAGSGFVAPGFGESFN